MKFKCDKCEKPATVHLTEIVNGEKTEKHLCEHCAATEGITIKSNIPLNQLLEDFVSQTSSETDISELKCEVCNTTFAEFRTKGLLGCPNDYDTFELALIPLLERAHAGQSRHIGKAPKRADVDQKRQNTILRLRAELKAAVATEDYEKAAAIRDQIKELES